MMPLTYCLALNAFDRFGDVLFRSLWTGVGTLPFSWAFFFGMLVIIEAHPAPAKVKFAHQCGHPLECTF